MLILDKTRINILVDVHFLIPTFQVVLIHINKVGNRINKVGHETTKWVNESTKWVNESTSWTAPNQPRGSRQLYATHTQLDWATMMFNETPFLGYPTCLLFAHVVWWWTAMWTARTTRRRRPGRSLTLGYIPLVEVFF